MALVCLRFNAQSRGGGVLVVSGMDWQRIESYGTLFKINARLASVLTNWNTAKRLLWTATDTTGPLYHTRPRGEVVLVPEQIPQSQWIR